MPIKALNPFAPYWYTPDSEKGEESPTRFKLCGLNGSQMADVLPEVNADHDGNIKSVTSKGVRLLLKAGLRDWENFDNDAGPVRFAKNAEANLIIMPVKVQQELAMDILISSFAQEAEKKTS